MKNIRNKSLLRLLLIILLAAVFIGVAFSLKDNTAHAYTDADSEAIGNIYNENDKCDTSNLDAFAQKVGYSGVDEMITVQDVECEHEYGEWVVTKQQTCTEDGERYRTCNYDSSHVEKQTLTALGHDFTEFTEDTAPTCTGWGVKSKHCSRCSEKIEETSIVPLGHDWVDDTVIAATCTTDGTKRQICKRDGCDATTKETTVAATGHNYGEPEWTWSSDYFISTAKFTCKTCKDVQTKSMDTGWKQCPVNKGNMDVTASVVFEGKKYTNFKQINNVYLPHLGDKIRTITAPTCVDSGKDLNKCKYCSQEYEFRINALGHKFSKWEVIKAATYTEEGLKTHQCSTCGEEETEAIPVLSPRKNALNITLNISFKYGDLIDPIVTAKYGDVNLTWYNTETDEELTEKPVGVGKYKLVARVDGNIEEGYTGVEAEAVFEIVARKITVKIKVGNSEKSEELEDLSAEVIDGTIIDGDTPYVLSTDADKTKIGEYDITGTCTNSNYKITFIKNIYIVSKNLEDSSGVGKIKLSADIKVKIKITDNKSSNDYPKLVGLSKGYLIQLWNQKEDDTLGDEFTDSLESILTLKIPVGIILSIFGDEEVDEDELLEWLRVYYIDSDGEYVPIEDYEIEEDEDGNWVIKFVYSGKFRAHIVFNNIRIVHKVIKDGAGLGAVNLPANIKVKIKIKQNETTSHYIKLNGLKIGYYVYIWRQGTSDESDDEFTDSMPCTLTLKIPMGIILSIFGDEEVDEDELLEWLRVYYIDSDGEYVPIEDYEIEEDEDGNWLIRFEYSGKFRAHIVFNSIRIVNKIIKDESGLGEVDLPANIKVKLNITQKQTTSSYFKLNGLKIGYYVCIWRQGISGETDDEFTDSMPCTLTLKIPMYILLSIFGDEEVDEDELLEWLRVYYIDSDGEYVPVEDYEIEEDEDGNWVIRFEYSGKFRAHIVFNSIRIVNKIIKDESGLGEVDLSVNLKVKLQIKQNKTEYDYTKLEGLKIGFLIYLWNQDDEDDDETEDDEFTGNISSTITLKIPIEIILTICGDEEVDKDKLVLWLKLYFLDVDGEYIAIDDFEIDKDLDGEWIIIFRHNRGYRAHIVFNNTRIVYKTVKADTGLCKISLPFHINVKLTIIENELDDYSELDGLKIVYYIRLWKQEDDDASDDEFTDSLDCTITLKIPIEILISIIGDGELDDESVIAKLRIYFRVYYVDLNGYFVLIENFDVDKDEDGNWIVKFNYSKGFGAKIVLNSIYILSKTVKDPDGLGAIRLPDNIGVELKITHNYTANAYVDLEGLNIGYWVLLMCWDSNGNLNDEVDDSINCILTLKVPVNIILAICGEDVDKENVISKLKLYLKVYYVNSDGEYVPIEDFDVDQDDESVYTVNFKYSKKFRAEIVFNTVTEVKVPTNEPIVGGTVDSDENSDSNGKGLIIGISAGVTVVILIILVITIAIRRASSSAAAVSAAAVYRSTTRRRQQKIKRTIRMERKYYNVSDEDEYDEE